VAGGRCRTAEASAAWIIWAAKRDGVWRVAEDDPHSDLYTEDAQADGVIHYIVTHSQREARHGRHE
jgi:hypothetical protein